MPRTTVAVSLAAADSALRAPQGTAPKRRLRRSGEGRHAVWFLTPWGIGVAWLVVVPSALAIYWSFTQFNLFTAPRWVGLQNYADLFHDPVFLRSVSNTLYMAFVGVVAGTGMGLGSAVLLHQTGKVATVLRAGIFLPAVVPPVATGIVWTFILNPDYGLLDAGLRLIGVPPIGWLSDPAFSKYGLLLMVLWGAVGQVMVTFVAAMQEVPAEILEAASLDGAGRVRAFGSVVLPELRPVLLYNVVIATLFYFQFFEQAFVVNPTNLGAPAQSTLTYALYLYQEAFTYLKMGSAAAMSVLLLLVSGVVIGIFFLISRRMER
jgi:multiple sugar transport system permease protein